jgi:hypothetical protein
MRQAERALGTISKRMETVVNKSHKAVQDPIQTTINLVGHATMFLQYWTDIFHSSRSRSKSAASTWNEPTSPEPRSARSSN